MAPPDLSEYVAHFTKDAVPLGKTHDPKDHVYRTAKGSARDRLVSILGARQPKILAATLPYTGCKAACFTECPRWSLLEHAKAYSPYGIGFRKEVVFAAGGGPVHYLRQDVFDHQFSGRWFGEKLFPFIRPFHPAYAPTYMRCDWAAKGKPPVDCSHEREWCVPSNFEFELSDVAFVVVQGHADLAALPARVVRAIGASKILFMDAFSQIESLWPAPLL